MEGPERRCPKGIEAKFPSCIVFSLPKHYNGRPRPRGVFAASAPSRQTRLSVDETSLRCFSSGQNPFSPDGKTFLQFIKFTLAADVPQKAYIGISLPRWREFECTLRRPPCQSELAEACESTSKTKAPVAATSLRAKTQKPTVSENKMSFAESEEACWRAKTKSSTRSRKTPFGS